MRTVSLQREAVVRIRDPVAIVVQIARVALSATVEVGLVGVGDRDAVVGAVSLAVTVGIRLLAVGPGLVVGLPAVRPHVAPPAAMAVYGPA